MHNILGGPQILGVPKHKIIVKCIGTTTMTSTSISRKKRQSCKNMGTKPHVMHDPVPKLKYWRSDTQQVVTSVKRMLVQ